MAQNLAISKLKVINKKFLELNTTAFSDPKAFSLLNQDIYQWNATYCTYRFKWGDKFSDFVSGLPNLPLFSMRFVEDGIYSDFTVLIKHLRIDKNILTIVYVSLIEDDITFSKDTRKRPILKIRYPDTEESFATLDNIKIGEYTDNYNYLFREGGPVTKLNATQYTARINYLKTFSETVFFKQFKKNTFVYVGRWQEKNIDRGFPIPDYEIFGQITNTLPIGEGGNPYSWSPAVQIKAHFVRGLPVSEGLDVIVPILAHDKFTVLSDSENVGTFNESMEGKYFLQNVKNITGLSVHNKLIENVFKQQLSVVDNIAGISYLEEDLSHPTASDIKILRFPWKIIDTFSQKENIDPTLLKMSTNVFFFGFSQLEMDVILKSAEEFRGKLERHIGNINPLLNKLLLRLKFLERFDPDIKDKSEKRQEEEKQRKEEEKKKKKKEEEKQPLFPAIKKEKQKKEAEEKRKKEEEKKKKEKEEKQPLYPALRKEEEKQKKEEEVPFSTLEKLKTKVKTLTKELKETEEALEDHQVADITTQFELKTEKHKNSAGDWKSLQQDLKKEKENLKQKERELKKSQEELFDALHTTLSALGERDDYRDLHNKAKNKITELEEKLAQKIEPKDPLALNVQALKNNVLQLKTELKNKQIDLYRVRKDLSAAKNLITQLEEKTWEQQTKVFELEKELSHQTIDLEGDRLENIRQLTELLLLREENEKIREENKQLKDKEKTIEKLKNTNKELVNSSKKTQKENKKLAEENLKKKNENEELENEKSVLTQNLEQKINEISDLTAQLLKNVPFAEKEEITKLEKDKLDLQQKLNKYLLDINNLKNGIDQLTKNNQKSEEEKKQFQQKITKLSSDLAEQKTEKKALTDKLSDLTRSSHGEEQELKKKVSEMEEKIKQLQDFKEKNIKLEKEKKQLTQNWKKQNTLIEDLKQRLGKDIPSDTKKEIEELENKNSNLKNELKKFEDDINTLQTTLNQVIANNLEANKIIQTFKEEKDNLVLEITELEKTIIELLKKTKVPPVEPSKRKVLTIDEEADIAELNKQIEDIRDEIRELIRQNEIEPDETQQEKRTNKIKKKRKEIIRRSKAKFEIWGLTYPKILKKTKKTI